METRRSAWAVVALLALASIAAAGATGVLRAHGEAGDGTEAHGTAIQICQQSPGQYDPTYYGPPAAPDPRMSTYRSGSSRSSSSSRQRRRFRTRTQTPASTPSQPTAASAASSGGQFDPYACMARQVGRFAAHPQGRKDLAIDYSIVGEWIKFEYNTAIHDAFFERKRNNIAGMLCLRYIGFNRDGTGLIEMNPLSAYLQGNNVGTIFVASNLVQKFRIKTWGTFQTKDDKGKPITLLRIEPQGDKPFFGMYIHNTVGDTSLIFLGFDQSRNRYLEKPIIYSPKAKFFAEWNGGGRAKAEEAIRSLVRGYHEVQNIRASMAISNQMMFGMQMNMLNTMHAASMNIINNF